MASKKTTPISSEDERAPGNPIGAETTPLEIDTAYFLGTAGSHAADVVSKDPDYVPESSDPVTWPYDEPAEEQEEQEEAEEEQEEAEGEFDLDDVEEVVRDANADQTTVLEADLQAVAERIEHAVNNMLYQQSKELIVNFAGQIALLKAELLAEITKLQGGGIPSESPAPGDTTIAAVIADARKLPDSANDFDAGGHQQILDHLLRAKAALSKSDARPSQAQRTELADRWNEAQLWVGKHIRSGTSDQQQKNLILTLQIRQALREALDLLSTPRG